jgi:uncharacterized protein (DUF1778 family)
MTEEAMLDEAAAVAQTILLSEKGQPTLFVVRDAVRAALAVVNRHRGPMLQIRVRGPISISELNANEEARMDP